MRRPHERGAALAAVLLSMALLLPLGAFAVLQSRASLLTHQSLRGDVEALHAAEAGLACAVSRLADGDDLDSLAAGPDGIPHNADDGLPPFALDCGAELPAPLGYEVRFERAASGLIIVARGRGTRAASRLVELHIGRDSSGRLERRGWRER
jgi:hypothetical protein